MLRELGDLYIPANDRQLRSVQRRGDDMDKLVRNWAQAVVEILPRGLPLNPDETFVLSLFLAQQRRLNLQMDAHKPESGFMSAAKTFLPALGHNPNPEVMAAAHRLVAARLDSDIDRACRFFCEDNAIQPDCEEAIDWRVAIRFMAQSVYSRVNDGDLKKVALSPRRFELALVARDLASEVANRRQNMFALNVTVDRRKRD
ncbi:MAG: hypothetical protein AAB092_09480 [Chloroflexota bacterium]